MMRQARVAAQAKVNLRLRVLAREPSGYHQLETVFARLALADDVAVRVDNGSARTLDCAGDAMPAGGLGPVEKNLAWRAALLYHDATGWPDGFAIEITKRIPVGGGMGGGSADAGAVLRALDAMNPTPIGPRILELAAQLGADVPFMAADAPMALAWGRGERMLALPALPVRRVQLVVPSFGVVTADAYRWLAESRPAYAPAGALLDAASFATWDGVAGMATNDFEGPAEARHVELARYREALARAGAQVAMLSGSGSTVFGVLGDRAPGVAGDDVPGARVIETTTAGSVVPVQVLV